MLNNRFGEATWGCSVYSGGGDGTGTLMMIITGHPQQWRRDLPPPMAFDFLFPSSKRALTPTSHFAEFPKCLPFISFFILFSAQVH